MSDRALPKQQHSGLTPRRFYEAYVQTTDDWYPNWEGNTVCVSVVLLNPPGIRISIWGADDDGMERDSTTITVAEAIEFVKSMPVPITKEWLESVGFVRG